MGIVKTITDDYYFWNWLKKSDNYSNNFSLEGAKALQEYYDNLGDEPIEFDPIAWCCGWSEYESLAEAWEDLGNGTNFIEGEELAIDDNIKLWLENNTQIIELDNGGVLVGEF